MNERILELLKQASKLANTDDNKDIDRNFDMIVAEKFAELIVKECLNIVMLTHNEGNADNFSYDDALDHVFSNMKEHFGVES
jgi:hypothetical protein